MRKEFRVGNLPGRRPVYWSDSSRPRRCSSKRSVHIRGCLGLHDEETVEGAVSYPSFSNFETIWRDPSNIAVIKSSDKQTAKGAPEVRKTYSMRLRCPRRPIKTHAVRRCTASPELSSITLLQSRRTFSQTHTARVIKRCEDWDNQASAITHEPISYSVNLMLQCDWLLA